MSVAERSEVAGLAGRLVADIAAGRIDASPAVTGWLAELHARLPVTDAEFEELLRVALAERLREEPPQEEPGHS